MNSKHASRRRRSLQVMAAGYLATLMSIDVAGRSGLTEGIPVLGWTDQGPLTAHWLMVSLAKHSIGTAIFVFLMSRFLPRAPETSA